MYMIDPQILAAILEELGYFDEDEQPTNKSKSETRESEQKKEDIGD